MLCQNCKHKKGRQIGLISTVFYCNISPKNKNGKKMGVLPWLNKPHPKCPLKEV